MDFSNGSNRFDMTFDLHERRDAGSKYCVSVGRKTGCSFQQESQMDKGFTSCKLADPSGLWFSGIKRERFFINFSLLSQTAGEILLFLPTLIWRRYCLKEAQTRTKETQPKEKQEVRLNGSRTSEPECGDMQQQQPVQTDVL